MQIILDPVSYTHLDVYKRQEWGFFVELPNTVEGLVRVTDLTDDFYEFYEDTYELSLIHI